MKQYRITAADFNPPSPEIDDAYLDPNDPVHALKAMGKFDGLALIQPPTAEEISQPATTLDKAKIQKEQNIKPGTPEWFQLWFSRPDLTGESPVNDK